MDQLEPSGGSWHRPAATCNGLDYLEQPGGNWQQPTAAGSIPNQLELFGIQRKLSSISTILTDLELAKLKILGRFQVINATEPGIFFHKWASPQQQRRQQDARAERQNSHPCRSIQMSITFQEKRPLLHSVPSLPILTTIRRRWEHPSRPTNTNTNSNPR